MRRAGPATRGLEIYCDLTAFAALRSLEQSLCLAVDLFGRHQLRAAIIEFLDPMLRFIEPEFVDFLRRQGTETLKEFMRQPSAVRGSEAKRFSFDGSQIHASIVPRGACGGAHRSLAPPRCNARPGNAAWIERIDDEHPLPASACGCSIKHKS